MGVCQLDFEPSGIRTTCKTGTLLSQAARDAGVGLVSVCGNEGTCGQCRIRILSGTVSPPTETERSHLSAENCANGYRLACRTRILGDVRIEVPCSSSLGFQKLQVKGIETRISLDPVIEQRLLILPPADIHDTRSDYVRLMDSLKASRPFPVKSIDLMVLRRLSPLLREHNWHIRVSIRGQEIVDIGPPDRKPLGLAVDLGTTKVACYLVDMETGELLKAEGMLNPQISFGEDIISRVTWAMKGEGDTLRQVLVRDLNAMLAKLCPEPESIVEVTAVGNTVMHHLFLGLPVKQLGLTPFVTAVKAPLEIKGRDLGLHVAPGAYISLLPIVGGFIGSDHTAMILAAGIYATKKLSWDWISVPIPKSYWCVEAQ
ncbi:MAG: 2Fe-2S iron-sulfur cluster-binding protein [Spirochaetota bacterium]